VTRRVSCVRLPVPVLAENGPVLGDGACGDPALVAAGADVLSITESRPTLEDVYLELIGDQECRSR